ncbi:MAG TPA: heme exporter protein CcmD [Patescibacteria group bacterium]|nr:heme exporter protein CcmD [Patescibacteria group bacterium]
MNLSTYFDMGGYAGFVWPAYALTALVMLALLGTTLRTLRAREATLKTMQETLPNRRGNRPAAPRS